MESTPYQEGYSLLINNGHTNGWPFFPAAAPGLAKMLGNFANFIEKLCIGVLRRSVSKIIMPDKYRKSKEIFNVETKGRGTGRSAIKLTVSERR
jgi:hypothetical protein